MAKKTKAQIEKEIVEVEAIKNQLQEEKRQADGLPSTADSARGAILREAQKMANQIVRERDALAQKTTTGKIFSRFDPGNDVISNRKETVTSGLWSNNSGELKSSFTSSRQTSSNAGRYYWDVYNSSSTAIGSTVQYAIAYGHKHGSGSLLTNQDYPTKAIYTQYKNLLLTPGDTTFTFDNSSDENHIVVLNIQRSRLKEKLDPGTWELVLSGSGGQMTKLIDDSTSYSAKLADGKRVYNIVSGTVANGIKTSMGETTGSGYGLVYPDLGVIILNPARLANVGITALGTLTGSNTNNHWNSQIYKAISGAASYNSEFGFQARNEEEITSTFYYIRVKNADYNFSNNPTYTTGSLGALYHSTMIKDPKTYITTVGMYNDKQELLATAKLSKPLLKSFDREALVKVKLDF